MTTERVFAIARHASSTWTGQRYAGVSNPPLSEQGLAEAAALAARVATSGLLAAPTAHLVASPRDRAVDTAHAVARATGRTVELDADWGEMDFGALEGQTFDALAAGWPDIAARLLAADTAIDWPDGETHAAFRARVLRALDRALASPGPVLVIAHGLVLRVVLVALLGPERGAVSGTPTPAGLHVLHERNGHWELEVDR